jgi:hypothetical protein
MLGVRKPSGSDMDKSNPCGDQTTHFIDLMECLNVANSTYKCKKMGTTFETRPTICIFSMN